jgi:4-diphosphocytidyl-2-C-methyl-D-erythritol kinase
LCDGGVVQAAAKINLSLKVTGRRDDGYHLLDTLVIFTRLGDVIDVQVADEITLTIAGPYAGSLKTDADNLVLKAAHLLKQSALSRGIKVPGAALTLTKNLPIASGIGGGSSDAAATLHGLYKLWSLERAHIDLSSIALKLGADVPMCLHATSLRATGIGEKIASVKMPALYLVLVNPGVEVSTAAVFSNLTLSQQVSMPPLPDNLSLIELVHWLENTSNDLQTPAIAAAPVIQDVLDKLAGCDDCFLARMSGSGATCFGLFSSMVTAEKAALQLGQQNPSWWCVASQTQEMR